MLFTDVIRAKRDGKTLTDEQIQFFVDGLADGSIPAEQVSALAMAIYLNSMSFEETGKLTMCMANSGTVLEWQDLESGRPGCGQTFDRRCWRQGQLHAGTDRRGMRLLCADDLRARAGPHGRHHRQGGIDTRLQHGAGLRQFRKIVKEIGCAMIGQTDDLAPADRRFYAIRDVTSTVESVPLITASILAKKIASNLDALVMDVKVGSGAFMSTPCAGARDGREHRGDRGHCRYENARTHYRHERVSRAGRPATRWRSRRSCSTCRTMIASRDSTKLCWACVRRCWWCTGVEPDRDRALGKVDEAVTSGRALEIFGKMVAALGGPATSSISLTNILPRRPLFEPFTRMASWPAVDAFAIGNAIIELGGGRREVGEASTCRLDSATSHCIGTHLDRTDSTGSGTCGE